jgi:predicted outer membrane repeat protein
MFLAASSQEERLRVCASACCLDPVCDAWAVYPNRLGRQNGACEDSAICCWLKSGTIEVESPLPPDAAQESSGTIPTIKPTPSPAMMPLGRFSGFALSNGAAIDVVVIIEDRGHLDLHLSASGEFPGSIACDNEYYTMDRFGNIVLPNAGDGYDCIHNQFAKYNGELQSLIYSPIADVMELKVHLRSVAFDIVLTKQGQRQTWLGLSTGVKDECIAAAGRPAALCEFEITGVLELRVDYQIDISRGINVKIYSSPTSYHQSPTLDATNVTRFFNVTGGSTLWLQGPMTLVNGFGSSGGALLVDEGSKLVLTDVVLQSNTARAYGGAIYAQNAASVQIAGCTFQSNRGDGADDNGGGAIAAWAELITITQSSFVKNNGGDGGALYIEPNLGRALLATDGAGDARSVASRRLRSSADGGRYAFGEATVHIDGVTFESNGFYHNDQTICGGGAISISSDKPKLTLTVTNSDFIGNTVGGYTGTHPCKSNAIFVGGTASLNLKNSNFSSEPEVLTANLVPAIACDADALINVTGCNFSAGEGAAATSGSLCHVSFFCVEGTIGDPATMNSGEMVVTAPPETLLCTPRPKPTPTPSPIPKANTDNGADLRMTVWVTFCAVIMLILGIMIFFSYRSELLSKVSLYCCSNVYVAMPPAHDSKHDYRGGDSKLDSASKSTHADRSTSKFSSTNAKGGVSSPPGSQSQSQSSEEWADVLMCAVARTKIEQSQAMCGGGNAFSSLSSSRPAGDRLQPVLAEPLLAKRAREWNRVEQRTVSPIAPQWGTGNPSSYKESHTVDLSDILPPMGDDAVALDAWEETASSFVIEPFLVGNESRSQELQRVQLTKQCIGHGSFGRVYAAEYAGKRVAVKMLHTLLDRTDSDGHFVASVPSNDLANEGMVVGELRHPHVVSLLGCIRIDGTCIGLMMELMEGGTLENLIAAYSKAFPRNGNELSGNSLEGSEAGAVTGPTQPPSQEQQRVLAKLLEIGVQITAGLGFLHSHNVIHRDLKPNNCLLTACWSVAKVADFGLSTKDMQSAWVMGSQSRCGNLAYMAPEVLLNNKGNCSMDVWSLAIILWELFSGASLYRTKEDRYRHVIRSSTQGLALPCPETFPPALTVLLRECWNTHWGHRPNCAELEQRLRAVHFEMVKELDEAGAAVDHRTLYGVLGNTGCDTEADLVPFLAIGAESS